MPNGLILRWAINTKHNYAIALWTDDYKLYDCYWFLQDNAGSGAIHVVAGMTALLGAIMLGPRTGRFDPSLIKDTTYRCHSVRVRARCNVIFE